MDARSHPHPPPVDRVPSEARQVVLAIVVAVLVLLAVLLLLWQVSACDRLPEGGVVCTGPSAPGTGGSDPTGGGQDG